MKHKYQINKLMKDITKQMFSSSSYNQPIFLGLEHGLIYMEDARKLLSFNLLHKKILKKVDLP